MISREMNYLNGMTETIFLACKVDFKPDRLLHFTSKFQVSFTTVVNIEGGNPCEAVDIGDKTICPTKLEKILTGS